jgi:hypothetical protein
LSIEVGRERGEWFTREIMQKQTPVVVDVFVAEDGTLYCEVREASPLVHEEHKVQTIQPGTYKVRRVQEVDPFTDEVRSVAD